MKQFIFLAAGLTILSLTASAQTKNFIDQPYIEVTGNADSLVTPNQIFIKILISERDTKNKVAVEELEAKMVEALKSLGINTETELTTSDMLSNYRIYFLKKKDILKSKEYMLKVKDAATAGKVFMKLEDLDISNASIDRVDHTDLENIKNACRAKSIENAKMKAIALAAPLGQTVGGAIFIGDMEAPSIAGEIRGRLAGVVVRGYGATQQKYEAPQVEFEKIKVSTTVNVKFILKNPLFK